MPGCTGRNRASGSGAITACCCLQRSDSMEQSVRSFIEYSATKNFCAPTTCKVLVGVPDGLCCSAVAAQGAAFQGGQRQTRGGKEEGARLAEALLVAVGLTVNGVGMLCLEQRRLRGM